MSILWLQIKTTRQKSESPKIEPPDSSMLDFENESFKSGAAGLLRFLPYKFKYGIDKLIENSDYPQTNAISRLSSILAFVCLKLSTVENLW